MIENHESHHTGVFRIRNEEISGELIRNDVEGTLLLNLSKTLNEREFFGKSYGTVKVISGKLNNGAVVTLFNNRCVRNNTQVFQSQNICFLSDYVIWSKSDQTGNKYNELNCVLENGLAWSRFNAFDRTDDGSIKQADTFEDKSFKWYGVTVTFSLFLKNRLEDFPIKEETIITQRLRITIKSDNKKTTDELLEIRNKIISLISFAIRSNVNVLEQYLIDYDDTYNLNDEITLHHRHFLYVNQRRLDLHKVHSFKYNFNLDQIPSDKDIGDNLIKLEPVFNLYLSLFKYRDMPIEMVFLNLIQALETFHARFFYDDDKKKYEESVKERFEKYDSWEFYEKFLLSPAQKRAKHIILSSRINDLIIGNDNPLFQEYLYHYDNIAQQITDTRHYYTHYGKNKEEKALRGNELEEAIIILRFLLEYHICLVLGIDIYSKIAQEMNSHQSWKQLDEI